jgi:hypothetical protein
LDCAGVVLGVLMGYTPLNEKGGVLLNNILKSLAVLLVGIITVVGFSQTAEAVELRITTAADLANCLAGVAIAAGPDAGKVPAPGDTCVLNPGVYATGAIPVTLANMTVRSVNGKFSTNIAGSIVIGPGIDGITIGGSGVDQGVTISGPGAGLIIGSKENFTLQNSDIIGNAVAGIIVAGPGSVRNFEFDNIEVRGNPVGFGVAPAVSSVSNFSFNDAMFDANTGHNIMFANSGEVSDVGFRNILSRSAGAGGAGIFFAPSVGEVRSSDISNSTIEANGFGGVVFLNSGGVRDFVFDGVECNSNGGTNVRFLQGGDAEDITVDNSSFSRAFGGPGIGMFFGNGGGVSGVEVENSEFDQNGTFGFLVAGIGDDFEDSSFANSFFRNNAGISGLAVGLTGGNSVSSVDFSNNQFTQNTGVGAVFLTSVGDVDDFSFNGDEFTKNGGIGLLISTGDFFGFFGGPFFGAGDIGEFTLTNINASENGFGSGVSMISTDGDITTAEIRNSRMDNNGFSGFRALTAQGGGTSGTVDNITVQNSTMNFNGTRAAAGAGSGALFNGNGVSDIDFLDSEANNNSDHGLDFDARDDVSDILVSNGGFSNNDSNLDDIGNGVHVNPGATGTATDILIENILANANNSGIVVDVPGRSGRDITIQNNSQVNDNRRVGIRVVAAEDLNDILIAGNTVQGNEFNIEVDANEDGTNIVISGNEITGASGTGILSDASGVSMNTNDIRNHDTGIIVRKHDNVVINNNNIARNDVGVDATNLGPGNSVDARNNWWGEPSGPGGEGPGIGDDVTRNVDYEPFLGSPAVETGASFKITDLTAPSQVGVNQPVNISATITNLGAEEGTQDVKLRILGNGGTVAQQDFTTTTLNPSGSTTVNYQVSLPEGTYTIEVSTASDTKTQPLTVGSGGSPSPSGSMAEALDTNNSGFLDDDEIISAIQKWILGQEVPGTGGQTISDNEMLALITKWILGEPV